MKFYALVFVSIFSFSYASEFLYPVGYDANDDEFFIIYQKSASHIELWKWNFETQLAHQLLLSRYTPAGFTLLPDNSGFSFIDNGLLKVKQLVKRSPRTIEYDAPIYNVERAHWLDNQTCYVSGKYQDYFGIFQIDWNGCVYPVQIAKGVDYQYPQKIDNHLFCIERSRRGYRIIHSDYYADYTDDEFQDRLNAYQKRSPIIDEILSFEDKPIAFLQMISESEGFVLSHSDAISKNDTTVHFEYYHLSFEDNWKASKLFSFDIPTSFFVGNDRLYESILPLLPNLSENRIYYVDSSETSYLSLYEYNLSTHSKNSLAAGNNQHIFGTLHFGGSLLYGGEILGSIGMTEGVQMTLGATSIT
jgi:hypothetical protein